MEIEYDFYKHYELKMKKSVFSHRGLTGLVNFGNICFMISILQCLSNTLSLSDYIISAQYKDDVNEKSNEKFVLYSYINLILHMWQSNQLIKPKTLVENICIFHKKYFALEQQDSHEFLMYLLEILHRSLSYEIEIEETRSSPNKLIKDSIQSWKNAFEKEYSVIIKTFYGSILNTIQCSNMTCGNIENVFEPYNCLQLDIDNKTNLYECLNDYFNEEEHINDWKCDKCQHFGCKKNTRLWSNPNYVIIQLKRFSRNGLIKNSNLVQYPIRDLDLTKYHSTLKSDNNKYIYDLYAVNYHSGQLNFGHYWSSCKNLDGHWYNFNDGNVTKITQEQLVTHDAYILFYHRKFIKKTLEI